MNIKTGSDPDHEEEIFKEAKFISLSELEEMKNFIPPVMKQFLIDDIKRGFSEEIINFYEISKK